MEKCEKKNMPVQSENCTRSRHICCSRATQCDPRDTRSWQAGFTIVEVMVAVVIFAVGLTAIAGMQTQSIAQSNFSDQMSTRVNAITHRAETLTRMPVKDETLELDGGVQINVTIGGMFEEETMCQYGESCDGDGDEYCDGAGWDEVDSANKSPHTLCQRVTQGYPLPGLVLVELEAVPKGVNEYKTKQRTVRLAYVRSTRWN
jgi:prepilin-type N-terminal cleavage/methylation domain-containing protein